MIISGCSKEGRNGDWLLAVLASGVLHLQHTGEDQDLPACLQDPATLMDCPEAEERQLLSSVPHPLPQFAGRLAYLSLGGLHVPHTLKCIAVVYPLPIYL